LIGEWIHASLSFSIGDRDCIGGCCDIIVVSATYTLASESTIGFNQVFGNADFRLDRHPLVDILNGLIISLTFVTFLLLYLLCNHRRRSPSIIFSIVHLFHNGS
jgi:hypothetical protein